MQSTKCYHGLTIMFNPKTLRLIVDLGSGKITWDQPIVLSISIYNFRNIMSIQLIGHDILQMIFLCVFFD